MVAITMVGLLLIGGLAAGMAAYDVYRTEMMHIASIEGHVTKAQAELQQANAEIPALSPVSPQDQLDAVDGHLNAAISELELARHEMLADKWLDRLARIDTVRKNRSAVLAFIDIGEDVTNAARQVVAVAGQLHVLQVAEPGLSPSERIYRLVEQSKPQMDAAAANIKDAAAKRARIDEGSLLPQLKSKLPELDKALNAASGLIQTYAQGSQLILPALGSAAPKRYLLLFADTAELRGSGGLLGSFGVLGYDKGKQAPIDMKNIYVIDDPVAKGLPGPNGSRQFINPPHPLAERIQGFSWALRDAAWSPDFPTMARQAEVFFKAEAGQDVDGVVVIDQLAAQELLAATGPIDVPGYGVTVTSDNMFQVILQKIEVAGVPQDKRKGFLAALAKAEMDRLVHLDPSRWPEAVKQVRLAAIERHIQVYSNDGPFESFMGKLGTTGVLDGSGGHDMVAVVDNQLGVTKVANQVDRDFSDKVKLNPDGSADHHLTLTYTNKANPNDQYTGGTFEDYLRVFVPAGAKLRSHTGFTAEFQDTSSDGLTVYQGWAYVPGRSSVTFALEYTSPPPSQKASGSYTLYWRKQAGVAQYTLHLAVTGPAGQPAKPANIDTPIATNAVGFDADRSFMWSY